MNKRKAAIIGSGFVGASIAFALMLDNVLSEIVLVDIDKNKAYGEATDIAHGVEGIANNDIYAGDYSDCNDCSIIIITAGRGRLPGESRIDLAEENIKIIRNVIASLDKYYNGCPVLMISNPVDILTSSAEHFLGQEEGIVFGSGCMLDSSRFKRCIARTAFPEDHKSQSDCSRKIDAFVVGEHGDAQIPLWSGISICGESADKYFAEHNIPWNEDVRQSIYSETKNMGASIIKAKGRTNYGIAICASRITRAVLDDEHFVASVSSTFGLENGEIKASLSLPSVIGRNGISTRISVNMTSSEAEIFEKSAAGMKEILCNII